MLSRLFSFTLLLMFCAAVHSAVAQSKRMVFKQPSIHPRPNYPMPSKGERPQGKGIFIVNINSDTGWVTSVSVKKSTGYATLDKAAIDALRRWRFWTPSVSSAEIPIEFKH
jgi:protein TonB